MDANQQKSQPPKEVQKQDEGRRFKVPFNEALFMFLLVLGPLSGWKDRRKVALRWSQQ